MKLKDRLSDIIVVIPFFNEEHFISSTLNCLARQKTDPGNSWEVVFVNNKSTDNTEKIINTMCTKKRIAYSIIHETRQGTVFSRKTGLDEASRKSSEIIISTDADTTFPTNFIETTYRSFTNKRIDVLSGDKKSDPKIDLWRRLVAPEIFNLQRKLWNLEYQIFGPYFFGSYFAVKTSFYKQIPLFNPEEHEKYMGEDILLSRRCHFLGGKFSRSKISVKPHDRRTILYQKKAIGKCIKNVKYPYQKRPDIHQLLYEKISKRETEHLRKKITMEFTLSFLWTIVDAYIFWVKSHKKYQNAIKVAEKGMKFIKISPDIISDFNGSLNQEEVFNNLEKRFRKQANLHIRQYLNGKR